ncbi:RNA-binding S4 domain protein [Paraburkholderia piptadeniae]|uniref:Dual-specificity RNA pseudouridine synthase RluF n=1 Tax=Paraburkholderia piptadeniae TaxID=1701573 RepID=A0A1N7S567_9BURK|nr:pseudouridine synthase [Paraburkholderia piptadeniae]SIT42498.1 RNA-binding S4 domain protein [Paraburkholderia piptadeniae]
MRVKLTAKHPRPASSERAPVRPGSTTARKPARPAAPAAKAAPSKGPRGGSGSSTSAAARRSETGSPTPEKRSFGKTAGAAGERRNSSTATRSGAGARSGDRPARATDAPARGRSESGSFERRSTGDWPARPTGAPTRARGESGSFERRSTGDRPARATRARGESGSFERRSADDRPPRKQGASASGGFRRNAEAPADRRFSSDRPSRGASAGERAPRFSRDDDAPRARRAPRDNDERRSAPRTARASDSESPRERTYARPIKAVYEGRDASQDRRPRSEGPARRASGDETSARSERTYAKPVKSAYADRGEVAPPKPAPAPRTNKAKRDIRSIEDSFDRPAMFDRPAAKPARKPRPVVEPRRRDEGEYNDVPGNLRLSKLMSELGLCSRREADEWIEKGWVTVDGVVVDTLGTKVRPDADIQIDPAAQAAQLKQVTILVHKPVGYVSGQAEEGYEPAVTLVKPENRWDGDRTDIRFSAAHLRQLAPAGRLDIDSTGLLVLTQDGRVAKQLIGGNSQIDKEYLVRVTYGDVETDVEHHFPAESLAKLRHGLELDGVPLKPAMVSWQNGEQLRFVLREGKKRQIRRMCELVGLHVVGLKRVRMGHVMLGALPPGQWRYLGPDESF